MKYTRTPDSYLPRLSKNNMEGARTYETDNNVKIFFSLQFYGDN
jgi:hypothetical protein